MRRIALALFVLALPRAVAASEVGCPARVVTPSAIATYYEPVAEGACSLPTAPGERFVAIASADFAGSEMCGRCLRVVGPEASVDVRVVDECPICEAGHLDFGGIDSFDLIADPIAGLVPISWETIACDVGAETMAVQFEGSHAYYLKVQVQNHRHGIASVDLAEGAGWLPMSRTLDNHFERAAAGTPFAAPFSFRITDVHGQVVTTDPIATLVNDVPIETGVQLEPCPEPAVALEALGALVALGLCIVHRKPCEGAARLRLATRETGSLATGGHLAS